MRKWKYTIQAKYFYHDNSLSIQEKGKLMGAAIERLPLSKIDLMCGYDLEDLAERFKNITGYDGITPVEEFDEYMTELYDIADASDIWIVTK